MAKSKQKTVRNRDDAARFGLAITDCLDPDCSMPQRSFTQKSTPLSIQSVPGKTSARAVAGEQKLLACGCRQSCRQHFGITVCLESSVLSRQSAETRRPAACTLQIIWC
jgi:hypothetical protein